ncbi:phage excisionase [Brucella microti CCM 4915]|uniref:Phage excisionase n=2 Tax=Brucella microti TaxID=444163 RepID=C7LJH1_BRUMC|nr:phage excisionase [Brucella microti CCM 4915]
MMSRPYRLPLSLEGSLVTAFFIASAGRRMPMQAGNENTGSQKVAFTVNEFCEIYGISRSLTYTELRAGRLTARKIGRRTIILKTDADAWLGSLPSAGAAA